MSQTMSLVGSVLLAGVLAAAAVSTLAWWASAQRPGLVRVGTVGAGVTAALAAAATLWLQGSLLGLLPDVPYSVRVSGPDLPFYYQVSAMWSALEGSLLLWLLVLAGVSALGIRSAPVRHRRLAAVTLMAGVAAFGVVALVASPFGATGQGAPPSPLLQDHVAMGVHPPLLYGGFAAAAVPHALAVAAAVGGQGVDGAWVDRVRRWTLAAWVLLTAGIGLGAWWSYAVLGWGGYWAWDPVENASLLPWLVLTALLHSLLPGARAVRRPVATVVLAGTAYALVLLAQFLTRSGVVLSVHAFTESPLGPVLLGLTVAATAVWLLPLLARRRPGQEPLTTRSPRRMGLLANLVLLVAVTVIVLIGTVLPTLIATFTEQRVAVGGPWYARTLAPVALVLLVLLVAAPWLPSHRGSERPLFDRAWPVLALFLGTVGMVALPSRDPWLALMAGLGSAALVSLLLPFLARRTRPTTRVVGGRLAHLAVVLGALAVVAGGHGTVREATVPLGGTVHAGSATATLVDLQRLDEGRRVTAEATVLMGRGEELLAVGRPSLRWYDSQSTMLTSPAIRTGLLDDVYVTLLEVDVDSGEATLRLAQTPLVGWLWASGALLVTGGVLTALPRRRGGPGVPRRQAAGGTESPPPDPAEARPEPAEVTR